MSKIVLEDYEISQDTLALIPAYHPDYYTIVIEPHHELYIRKTPFQLIKSNCLDGGADYEGRRKAVIHKTGAKNKVPIPVNPGEGIYMMPSHSAEHPDCHWFAFHHIMNIHPIQKKRGWSVITFNNYFTLKLHVSHTILIKQRKRTSLCIHSFGPKSFPMVGKFDQLRQYNYPTE